MPPSGDSPPSGCCCRRPSKAVSGSGRRSCSAAACWLAATSIAWLAPALAFSPIDVRASPVAPPRASCSPWRLRPCCWASRRRASWPASGRPHRPSCHNRAARHGAVRPLLLLVACLRPAWRRAGAGVAGRRRRYPHWPRRSWRHPRGTLRSPSELPGLRLAGARPSRCDPARRLALLWSAGGLRRRLPATHRGDIALRRVLAARLAGSLGVFMADDLVGFYLLFALARVCLPMT